MTITVEVEASARIARGIGVPYKHKTLVADPIAGGRSIVYYEVHDDQSIRLPQRGQTIPVLIGHDRNRPTGRLVKAWHSDAGLEVELELIGSDHEVEGLRQRAAAGVQSGLSISFVPNTRRDIWTRPQFETDFPIVLRRDAILREVSIVTWPAFDAAKIRAIRNRTETQIASDEILGEHREQKRRAAAARRIEAQILFAELDEANARHDARMAQLTRQAAEHEPAIRELFTSRLVNGNDLGPPPVDPGPDATDDERWAYTVARSHWDLDARDHYRHLAYRT